MESGSRVRFREIKGMEQLNGTVAVVEGEEEAILSITIGHYTRVIP